MMMVHHHHLSYCINLRIKQNEDVCESFGMAETPPTRAYIAVTLVSRYLCVTYKVFSRSVSHCLLHPCEVDGLIAISQIRERAEKDKALQPQSLVAERSLMSPLLHSHGSEAAKPAGKASSS